MEQRLRLEWRDADGVPAEMLRDVEARPDGTLVSSTPAGTFTRSTGEERPGQQPAGYLLATGDRTPDQWASDRYGVEVSCPRGHRLCQIYRHAGHEDLLQTRRNDATGEMRVALLLQGDGIVDEGWTVLGTEPALWIAPLFKPLTVQRYRMEALRLVHRCGTRQVEAKVSLIDIGAALDALDGSGWTRITR